MTSFDFPFTKYSMRSQGFTLFELLVVMVIIAIVLSMAMPHLSVSHSQARQSAASLVGASLEKAQTIALTQSSYAAVVFAHNQPRNPALKGRRMGVFLLKKKDPNSFSIDKQVGRWIALPKSTILVNEAPKRLKGQNILDCSTPLQVTFPSNSAPQSAHAIIFNPQGSIALPEGSGVIEVHIASGGYTSSGHPIIRPDKAEVVQVGRLSGRWSKNPL